MRVIWLPMNEVNNTRKSQHWYISKLDKLISQIIYQKNNTCAFLPSKNLLKGSKDIYKKFDENLKSIISYKIYILRVL